MYEEDENTGTYAVVLNHEEQYSIWPADQDPPEGWRREGTVGTKAECLSHIDLVWTDMRPLSLRRAMAAQEDAPAAGAGNSAEEAATNAE